MWSLKGRKPSKVEKEQPQSEAAPENEPMLDLIDSARKNIKNSRDDKLISAVGISTFLMKSCYTPEEMLEIMAMVYGSLLATYPYENADELKAMRTKFQDNCHREMEICANQLKMISPVTIGKMN